MNCCVCQGYRTGHMYRDAATGQRYGRASSEADIATKKLSLANDTGTMSYVFVRFIHVYASCFCGRFLIVIIDGVIKLLLL